MATVAQRSFAAGEVGPELYPRPDMIKYATGARTMRNMFVKKHGGASNRPGFSFVCEVKDSSKRTRVIPFRHTDALTCVLEFADSSVRAVQNGSQVRNASQNITGITAANPAVLTYAGADNFANGDNVYVTGVVGAMANFVNDRTFKVAGLNAGANTFQLNYPDGTAVNSTAWGSYTSGGTVSEVLQILDTTSAPTALYSESELFDISYQQIANALYLAHIGHPARKLIATAILTWTNAVTSMGPNIAAPTNIGGVRGAAGSKTFKYKVTSVANDTFEESLANIKERQVTISSTSNANPAVCTTSTSHLYATGDSVFIKDTLYGLNGYYTITVLTGTTFSIPVDKSAEGAPSLGGFCYRDIVTIVSAADGTAAAPCVLSWTAATNAREYNIYKEKQGLYCYHGTSATTTYNDEGGNGDPLDNPPEVRTDINDATTPDADTYPAVVASIQQRLAFAQTTDNGQTGWASKTALENNFTRHYPLVDDDSVKFTLAGELNEIRHLLDLGSIVCLTKGGEWVLQGDQSGFLTPTQVNPKQVGYNGSSKLKPVLINNNALYVQALQGIVRDLAFDFSVDGYKGNDLTIFSSHLFDNHTIVDWTYQQVPNSIVWAVRDDGVLLGLTYLREQEILAWHHHDTDGFFESVATVREGTEDVVYAVIRRTIGGVTKRYIERMNTRTIDDIEDCVFMDSAVTRDGRHTGVTTMTLSGGTTWTYEEDLTITASASTFAASDVGKQIHLVGSDGTKIRFTLTAYTSGTVMTGRAHRTVPASMQSTAIGNASGSWGLARADVTGLWHMEGKEVSVFADGFVVGSPNNAEVSTTYTVTNGTITLDKPYVVVHVGLPFISDLETLDLDTVQGETLVDKKKLTAKFTAWFEKTRGIFSGPKAPADDADDPLDGLFETEWRTDETQDEPPDLFTGTKSDLIRAEWNSHGRVFMRQVDPVPVTVQGIAPSGMIPFRAGG